MTSTTKLLIELSNTPMNERQQIALKHCKPPTDNLKEAMLENGYIVLGIYTKRNGKQEIIYQTKTGQVGSTPL